MGGRPAATRAEAAARSRERIARFSSPVEAKGAAKAGVSEGGKGLCRGGTRRGDEPRRGNEPCRVGKGQSEGGIKAIRADGGPAGDGILLAGLGQGPAEGSTRLGVVQASEGRGGGGEGGWRKEGLEGEAQERRRQAREGGSDSGGSAHPIARRGHGFVCQARLQTRKPALVAELPALPQLFQEGAALAAQLHSAGEDAGMVGFEAGGDAVKEGPAGGGGAGEEEVMGGGEPEHGDGARGRGCALAIQLVAQAARGPKLGQAHRQTRRARCAALGGRSTFGGGGGEMKTDGKASARIGGGSSVNAGGKRALGNTFGLALRRTLHGAAALRLSVGEELRSERDLAHWGPAQRTPGGEEGEGFQNRGLARPVGARQGDGGGQGRRAGLKDEGREAAQARKLQARNGERGRSGSRRPAQSRSGMRT